ncbi:ElaA protein [Salinibacillus kushneri]|uniref:ElaA protein n=1 Tax=Salinibacillus kushneri TaxID=237682 RepID=A0A1I0BBR8_9BACI|nr:GNAT family N-acetyltransferase [Salinibacillus kushneri]SET04267.1 ElaA protein [Salinibacillus kushneri]
MQWIQKEFNQLTARELYTLLRERVNVFVVEQNCPYPEIDDYDQDSTHLYLEDDGEVAAYCRLLPHDTIYHEASIGRILVKNKFRKQGYAKELMKKALRIMIEDWGESEIKLHAQSHLQNFYGQYGFKTITDEYLDDGILHVDMILQTKKK